MIQVVPTGVFGVNSIIVTTGENKCFVVDPAACMLSGDETKIINYLSKNNLQCEGIVLTHSHFDHITGIASLKKAFPNAKVAIHEAEAIELQNAPGPMNSSVLGFFGMEALRDLLAIQPAPDVLLKEGMDWFGWKVMHTPGHSPGSICLYNAKEKKLISGDTLFAYGGYGRTDMYGGDEALIMRSLGRLEKEIPAGTEIYPGHDAFGFSKQESKIGSLFRRLDLFQP